MNDKQSNKLANSIDNLTETVQIFGFIFVILGLLGGFMAVDKIAIEVHDAGRVITHAIEHGDCR